MACSYASIEVLSHFDSLLGYFAIISGEEHPPATTPKILLPGERRDLNMEKLDEFNRVQQWGIFKQGLQKCLEELCKARPSEVFDSVSGCLTQPSPHLEDGFNACCVSLLSKLGKDYLLRSRMLPLIWRALMDYSSTLIRAVAIDATVEMFSHSNSSPPANLVDVIILHLRDPKVIVHKAALRAVSRSPHWFDEKQSVEVLDCLATHLHVYRNDKYQLDDICDGILAIGHQNERLKLSALRMVKSIFPTGEELVDSQIAQELIRFCKPSDRMAQIIAKDIGTFLGLYDRDRNNDYGYSKRRRMFEWMHQLPAATYQRTAEYLVVSADKLAKRDAWESCYFASLFAQYRDFRNEHLVLAAAADALPEEKRYESFCKSLRQLAIVAAGNASLQLGDIEAAEAYFAKGKGEA